MIVRHVALAEEHDICVEATAISELINGGSSAARLMVTHSDWIGRQSEYPELIGAAGGRFIPEWWWEDPRIFRGRVELFHLREAYFYPAFGVLVTPEGQVMRATFGEAGFLLKDVSSLPFAELNAEGIFLNIPDDCESFDRVAVTMPWGACTNYGHFLIDCLSGVALLKRFSEFNSYNYLFPLLRKWHARHFELMGVSSLSETDKTVVLLKNVVYTGCIDHFLHRVTDLTVEIAKAQKACLTQTSKSGALAGVKSSSAVAESSGLPAVSARIYLSRREIESRNFSNEAEVEEVMFAKGFSIMRPEKLSVDEQIIVFSRASLVVGFTGAAFANIIYCSPKTKVIEIQTEALRGIWVRNLSLIARCRWYPFFAGDIAQLGDAQARAWDTDEFRQFVERVESAD